MAAISAILVRVTIVSCLMIAGQNLDKAPASTLPSPGSTQVSIGEAPLANVPPEVHLRRLHLVRPDLIPYPVAFQTYC